MTSKFVRGLGLFDSTISIHGCACGLGGYRILAFFLEAKQGSAAGGA